MSLRSTSTSPTARVLVALLAGLALGIAIAMSRDARLLSAAEAIEPLGVLWVNAIRMTVIPLVVSMLITSIAERSTTVGRLGGRALVVFASLLTLSATYAMIAIPFSMRWLTIDAATSQTLRAGATATAAETSAAIHDAPGFRAWLVDLVPTNPIQAAASGRLLPLIVFTVLFALALARLKPESSEPVVRVFRALADVMLVLVRWIIALAPLGVFTLIVPTTARLGTAAAGALGYYLAATVLLAIGFLIVLYPVVAMAARIPIGLFARAALPGQAVAIGTSSSLAALPGLIDGTDRVLRMPPAVSGFVLPLAASTFKITSPIAKVTGALFLARLYGVEIGFTQLLTLTLASVLLSASTPGVPHAWLVVLAPMLVSAGIPPEGIGLLMAVDLIPDMAYTTVNATGYIAAAAIVGRSESPGEQLTE